MTVETLESEFVAPPGSPYVFTALDRCDGGYSEQAYHRATKDGKEIFLCNHHYHAGEDKLLLGGWTIESDVTAITRLGGKMDAAAY